jgi:hypothetical protein
MTQITPEPRTPGVPAPSGRGCAPWLIGCGATLAIVLLVGGGGAWWFVGRPLLQVYGAVQDVQRIETLDARVSNRAPYAAPADGLLSEIQVTRFLGVQRRMGDAVTGRLERLQGRFEELDGREFRWSDALRLAGVYTEFFQAIVETKESQVAALNAEGLSVAEYAWVRREVLRAAGVEAAPDLGAVVGAMTSGAGDVAMVRPAGAPQANRDLVERYREELDETIFLAVIGL